MISLESEKISTFRQLLFSRSWELKTVEYGAFFGFLRTNVENLNP